MTQELSTLNFTQDQLQLITNTVAKGATPDELKLFLYRCKNLGLDPLKPGQIHFVKYGNSPGSVVVGIDGFRAKAVASGKLSGIKRGVIRNDKGLCVGAWAEVYRTDWSHPAREEVSLAEYNTGKAMWAKMPETMVKKVAEAAALRMAFPDQLGGVYESAEMDQASESKFIKADQPAENDGFTASGVWKFDFGKWRGKTVEEVYNDTAPNCGPDGLKSYVNYLVDSAYKKNEPLSAKAQDVINQIETFLGAVENKIAAMDKSPARSIIDNIQSEEKYPDAF